VLTSKQRSDYERDGFLVIEKFVAAPACDALRRRAELLVSEFDPQGVISVFSTIEQTRSSDDYFLDSGDKIRFFFEENAFNEDGTLRQRKELSINKIGHALHDLDPVFNDFSRTADLAQLIVDLGIREPLLIQSMFIFKQPNIGGEVGCHQDSTFLYTEPDSVVGLWFALEDATIENGCLWAIPGVQQAGLKLRFLRDGRRTRFEILDPTPWPTDRLVPLEVPQGTVIILNGGTPHLSRANLSPRSRHAYTLHVIDAKCHYAPDNWLHRSTNMPARGF
jgi:phytanoyl-CoA hydroxylase